MREIKFRGKRVDNGEWAYGYLLEKWAGNNKPQRFAIDPCISFYEDGWTSWPDDVVDVIPESVGQFTGLYGENGKEIFEGDIVKIEGNYKPGIYTVIWDSYRVAWWLKNIKKREREYDDDYCQLLNNTWQDREVIGNTYENPYFLEV